MASMTHSASLQPAFREFDPNPSSHCRALDGIRGLAILLVFCFDCLKIPNDGGIVSQAVRILCGAGWTGVDLFFVLSGFLITGILLDTKGRRGYFSSFFGRRAVRIFPLYYMALVLAFWIVPSIGAIFFPDSSLAGELTTLRQDQGWFFSYLQNWMFVARGAWPQIGYLNHFWSLAIEEQFYFVWPVIVALLLRRRLLHLSLILCVAALALRCWLRFDGADKVVLHACTLTRIDSLCFGAIAAILIRDPVWYPRLMRWSLPAFCGLGLLLLGIDRWQPILQTGEPLSQTVGHTLLGMMYAALILWAAGLRAENWKAGLIGIRPLTILGQFSYALYVLHRPVHSIVKQLPLSGLNESTLGIVQFVVTLSGSLAVAWISWHILEKPCLSLKKYFPRPEVEPTVSAPSTNSMPQSTEMANAVP